LSCSAHLRALHSFPTRRSSDLPNFIRQRESWRPATEVELNHFPFWIKQRLHQVHFPFEIFDIIAALLLIGGNDCRAAAEPAQRRSEEHTSELQSRFDLVCRLLL